LYEKKQERAGCGRGESEVITLHRWNLRNLIVFYMLMVNR
jgi:hypothetical protein